MKRAAALIDLSREHHEALVLARRACAAAPGSDAAVALHDQLLRRWPAQFEPHFAHEEHALLPALEAAGLHSAAARVHAEHAQLRALAARLRDGDLTALAPWGETMLAHVRHEERELFPLAERTLDLDRLPRHTAAKTRSLPLKKGNRPWPTCTCRPTRSTRSTRAASRSASATRRSSARSTR